MNNFFIVFCYITHNIFLHFMKFKFKKILTSDILIIPKKKKIITFYF